MIKYLHSKYLYSTFELSEATKLTYKQTNKMLFSSKFVAKFPDWYGVDFSFDKLKETADYSDTKTYSFIEEDGWISIYENVKPEERIQVNIKYNLLDGKELVFQGKVKEVLDVNGKVMLFPRRIFNEKFGYSLPIGSEITINFKN